MRQPGAEAIPDRALRDSRQTHGVCGAVTEMDRRPVHVVRDDCSGAEYRPGPFPPGDQGADDEEPRVGERKRPARAWDVNPRETVVSPNLARPRDHRQPIAIV